MARLPRPSRASAIKMAETIFGLGVLIVGASFSGSHRGSGVYAGNEEETDDATPAGPAAVLSTGQFGEPPSAPDTANLKLGEVQTDPGSASEVPDRPGQPEASWIDVDFIPTEDTLALQLAISSDNPPEVTSSLFQDIVGVWVNTRPADLVVGTSTVSPSNGASQGGSMSDALAGISGGGANGFTALMTLVMRVVPNQVNSVRIGVADQGGSGSTTALIVSRAKGGGGNNNLITVDDTISLRAGATQTFDFTANDQGPGKTNLLITHLNGQAVVAGDTITLPTGETLTLNADGTVMVTADTDLNPLTTNFTYTVSIGTGNAKIGGTGTVTLNTIPCFVVGTRIRTPHGDVPVEDLEPGDLVETRDDGPQPVRWVGRRTVPATGVMAPVRISAGALGEHGTLLVSPLHRVLIADRMAELLFAEQEVLVTAKDLVDDQKIRQIEGDTVEYVHILFDRHQIVFSEGLATESFLPGPQTTQCFGESLIDEIRSLFPDLDPLTGQGYSGAARRTLKSYEARILLAPLVAA